MSLDAGQVFAGYTILRVLGSGGMGRVYPAAHPHPRLPREDALKVLPPQVTADAQYRERFVASGPYLQPYGQRSRHQGRGLLRRAAHRKPDLVWPASLLGDGALDPDIDLAVMKPTRGSWQHGAMVRVARFTDKRTESIKS